MDTIRRDSLLAGQTNLARKVYEAVPIAEPWSLQEILSEMHRLGHNITHNNTRGCLRDLSEAGLVREPSVLAFVRERVTEKPMKAVQKESAANDTALTTPFDVLSTTAVRLRRLADDLDTLALQLHDENSKNAEALKAFEAFKQLVKGMA